MVDVGEDEVTYSGGEVSHCGNTLDINSIPTVGIFWEFGNIMLVGGLEHEFIFPNSWDDDPI